MYAAMRRFMCTNVLSFTFLSAHSQVYTFFSTYVSSYAFQNTIYLLKYILQFYYVQLWVKSAKETYGAVLILLLFVCSLHDRKLCVLGLCTLLNSVVRPVAVSECAAQIIPSLILLFDGLKRAYIGQLYSDMHVRAL